jgi:hypothetical protein
MLGLTFKEFKIEFNKHFIIKNGELIYTPIYTSPHKFTVIELPDSFSKEYYSDVWNLYNLFFRFDNELSAFNFYKTFLPYGDVLKMCKVFVLIYKINIQCNNEKIQQLGYLSSLDLTELGYLINTQYNDTKNKRILEKSKYIKLS